jgi:hypothetical protein
MNISKIEILTLFFIIYHLTCANTISIVLHGTKRKENNSKKITHLVTYNQIIDNLSLLEGKLLNGRLTDEELNLIFKLKIIMDKQKRRMKAPAVYWYSRQGR